MNEARWLNNPYTVIDRDEWAVQRLVAFCRSCGRTFDPPANDIVCECGGVLVEAAVRWAEYVPRPDPLVALLIS